MTVDPFADVRDKRMSELNEEQLLRANEMWLREQIGPSESYWYPHLQTLFKIIDALRAQVPKCACGDRPAALCDEQWGPGCDLGNNEKYVRVGQSTPPDDVLEVIDEFDVVAQMLKRGAEANLAVEVVATFGTQRAEGATIPEAALAALCEWDIA